MNKCPYDTPAPPPYRTPDPPAPSAAATLPHADDCPLRCAWDCPRCGQLDSDGKMTFEAGTKVREVAALERIAAALESIATRLASAGLT